LLDSLLKRPIFQYNAGLKVADLIENIK